MVAVKKKRRTPKEGQKVSLEVFVERYMALLYAAKEFLTEVAMAARKSGEDPWVTTAQVVNHIVEHRPAAYIKSFGIDHPKEMKAWRLMQILRNANYLGAYSALGIRVLHGRGMALESATKKPKLEVVK